MPLKQKIRRTGPAVAALAVVAAAAAVIVATALARDAAVPTPTAIPHIEGAETPFVGDTLTATTGTWSGNPTRYAFGWDRCDPVGDRRGCTAISGATTAKYKLTNADVNHTLRVRVTATNASGSATTDSKGTNIVSDAKAPSNRARPTVTGVATVGSTLTADEGTWAGATSFSYEWQSCDADGNNCNAVAGATGKTYGVRATDLGHTLRVRVTAKNKYGTAGVTSDRSNAVKSGGGTTTGCSNGSGTVNASALNLPQRMLIDRWSFTPNVVTPSTESFVARIHVALADGCSVSGAQLWSTAIPYNQTSTESGTTGSDGWATLTFRLQGGFPANPGRQQILALLVRATKPGGSTLAGVSTRRAIAERVSLR